MTLKEQITEVIASALSDNDVRPRTAEILTLIKEEIEKAQLTDEEIGQIEWESSTLDMSFVDDYKDEVKALLEAQLQKILKALE